MPALTTLFTFLRTSWWQLLAAALIAYVAWDYKSAKDSVVSLTSEVHSISQAALAIQDQATLLKQLSEVNTKLLTDVVSEAAASGATLKANVAAIKEVAKHAPIPTCALPDSLTLAIGQLRQPAAAASGDQR